MKSCFQCLKFLVTFFNCLIMISGLTLTGLCIWVYVDYFALPNVHSSASSIIYICMGIGGLMAVMGFLGCCGALRESKCMLGVFFSLVLFLLCGQIAICIWSYLNFKTVEGDLRSTFKETLKEYNTDDAIKKVIDTMQLKLECCGSSGPQDWQQLEVKQNFSISTNEIPSSCYNSAAENYPKGCSDKIIDFIKENKTLLLIIAIGISSVEIFALIFTFILCVAFRKIDQYY